MKNQRIQDKNDITKNYEWTNPVETQGVFGIHTSYSIGSSKDPSKAGIFKKVYKGVSVPKIQFKKRQTQLQKLQHEFSIPITFSDIRSKKLSKDEVIYTDFTIMSQYLKSISVQNFIKQKCQLILSDFVSIVQQVVNLMTFAQKLQIFHYHLNANSILLIQQNEENTEFLVKVTDWGFQNQICSRKDFKKVEDFLQKICSSSMFEYFHPELLFSMQNFELYQKYKSKYDIWAFGIVLYRMAFLKRAFKNNGSYSPEILENYYKKKQNLKLQNPSLITIIIQKMLSLHEFNTWAEIKAFMIEKCEKMELDFLPIKDTLSYQQNFLTYLIEIYKIGAWNIHNSEHSFLFQNKPLMEKFLFNLIKFMRHVHMKFLQRFRFRVGYLTAKQIQPYGKLIHLVESQSKRVETMETQKAVNKSFFDFFQKYIESLIPFQTRIQDLSSKETYIGDSEKGLHVNGKCKSLSILKEFTFRMIEAKKKMQNYNKKILPSLYESVPQKS